MDWFHSILDFLRGFWPLVIVEQWERGGFYVVGRWRHEVGPGCYFVVPWFTDVKVVSIATAYAATGRKDITLADGSSLMYEATIKARVADVRLVLNTIDDFKESATEAAAAILSEKLAEVDVERLQPGRRGRLFSILASAVKAEAAEFGVEVLDVYFTSLLLNTRSYRLLGDGEKISPW